MSTFGNFRSHGSIHWGALHRVGPAWGFCWWCWKWFQKTGDEEQEIRDTGSKKKKREIQAHIDVLDGVPLKRSVAERNLQVSKGQLRLETHLLCSAFSSTGKHAEETQDV